MEESKIGDPRGRHLLSKYYGKCSLPPYADKTFDDIEKIVEDAKLPKQVQSTNVLNYKQTIKSLLINEIKLAFSPAAEMDPELFQKYLEKLFPGSNKAPYNLAFQEAVNEVKKMNVQPIDIDELNEEHIKFSKKINSFCKEMNKEFKEFGKMGFWGKVNAWTAGFGTKRLKFINDKEKELLTLVDQLAKKQSYGALLAADAFRKDVFDPTTDNAYNCIVDDKYQPMKSKLDSTVMNKAQDNLKKHMGQDIDLIKKQHK